MSAAPGTRPRPARRGDDGLTLVELLVTMVILGIVGSVVAGMVASTGRSITGGTDRLEAANTTTIVMENISKATRAAVTVEQAAGTELPAFANATATTLTVYAAQGSVPVRVAFALDTGTGTLTETRTPGTGTSPNVTFTGPSTTRILAHDLVNDASNPLFTYHAYDSTTAALTALPASPTQPALIRAVTISPALESNPTDVPVVSQRIVPPNLEAQ